MTHATPGVPKMIHRSRQPASSPPVRPVSRLPPSRSASIAWTLALLGCGTDFRTEAPAPAETAQIDPVRIATEPSGWPLSISIPVEPFLEPSTRLAEAGLLHQWVPASIPAGAHLPDLLIPSTPDARGTSDTDDADADADASPKGSPSGDDESQPQDTDAAVSDPPDTDGSGTADTDAPDLQDTDTSIPLPDPDPSLPWFGLNVPEPGGAYEAPEWFEVGDGLHARRMIWPTAVEARVEEGRLVLEATFQVAAGIAKGDPGPGAPVYACGCDGRPWCGREELTVPTAVLRWTLDPALTEDWRLTGDVDTSFHTDARCRHRPSRGSWTDHTEEIFAPLQAWGESFATDWPAWLGELPHIFEAAEVPWAALHQPTPAATPPLVLFPRPKGMHLSALHLTEEAIKLDLVTAMRPVLSPMREVQVHPLPPLRTQGLPQGFRVVTSGSLPVDTLSQSLQPLQGRRFPNRPRDYIEVASARIYGGKEHAILHVAFIGDARGDAYFRGRLEIDEERGELYLSDIEPTENTLASLTALEDVVEAWNLDVRYQPWIEIDAFLRELHELSRWSLDPEVARLRVEAERALSAIAPRGEGAVRELAQRRFQVVALDGEAARFAAVLSSEEPLPAAPDPEPGQ